MIIVKLTILSIVITAIGIFAIKVWVDSDPIKAAKARIQEKYPKWILAVSWLCVFDALGILASTIWLLFFR